MPFGFSLISKSSANPLASGFYKLLACCMRICAKTKFFEVNHTKRRFQCFSLVLLCFLLQSLDAAVLPAELVATERFNIAAPLTESELESQFPDDDTARDVTMTSSADEQMKLACFQLFTKFTREVSLSGASS